MNRVLLLTVSLAITACSSVPKLSQSNDACYSGSSFNEYSHCINNELLPTLAKNKHANFSDIDNTFAFSNLIGTALQSGAIAEREAKGGLYDYVSSMIEGIAYSENN